MVQVLVYVDQDLACQIATGLIGSEVGLRRHTSSKVGVNFKVLLERDAGEERASSTRIESLLPEVLVEAVYEALPLKVPILDDIRDRLVAGAGNGFPPGTPLLVEQGTLEFAAGGNPILLAGENCEKARFQSGRYEMDAYLHDGHVAALRELSGEPLQVMGVLRWTPPYSIPGSTAINLGLRIAAIWLG